MFGFQGLLAAVWVCSILIGGIVRGQVSVATAPSYAPINIECPSDQALLRLAGSAAQSNQTLCQGEIDFRAGRKTFTSPLWKEFFTTGVGANTGYTSTSLLTEDHQDWPIFALAHSGGGARAALFGSGVVKALDSRTTSSSLRGILQLATYQSGLSGGSWLVMSLATQDYPTIDQLVSGWQLERDAWLPAGPNLISNSEYWENLVEPVQQKKSAGFKASLADPWGLALGGHFLPGTSPDDYFRDSSETANGAGILFSALSNSSGIKDFRSPYPIILSNNWPPRSTLVNDSSIPIQGKTFTPLSTTVFEFSPHEFGSFDPYLSAFTPMEYLGTRLSSGKPSSSSCVRAFDQASLVMGTSAAVFNTILSGNSSDLESTDTTILQTISAKISEDQQIQDATLASYPNPFKGVNGPSGFDGSASDDLNLVDGGENGENVPLNPFLAPARQVDVLFAADASADTNSSDPLGANWPNGASMMNTFIRVNQVFPTGSASFPPVPTDPQVWTTQGLKTRASFFGCDAITQEGNGGFPLVVYIPNNPLAQDQFHTNTSTFKSQYSEEESVSFLDSTMKTLTTSIINSQVDQEWPTCLSCALIDRSRNRRNLTRSDVCNSCFDRYCYNPQI